MKVFLDTNVILDFYDSDRGHYQPAAIIFDLTSRGEISPNHTSDSENIFQKTKIRWDFLR